jgi:DnaJ domain
LFNFLRFVESVTMKTLYDLLAVSPDADPRALKTAFRKAVKANHPDLHPEDPRVLPTFMQIVAANSILSDAVQRAAYDQSLKLERRRRQLEGRRSLMLDGRGLLIRAAIVFTVTLVGAHWIYTPASQPILTAINSNGGAARTEIVAVDVGAAGSVPAMKPQSVPTPVAPAPAHRPASLPPLTTWSSAQNSPDTLPTRAASRRLTIDAVRLRQTDALLTISAADVGSDAAVVVGGLSPGSTLSAGTPAGPNRWRLSTEDLGDVVLAPPRGFVGAMDLSLELRLADQAAVDRKALQLEWSAKDTLAPPKSQRFGAAEIALMTEKGAALIAIGDVGGARMMFQPAAEAGDPAAAFALAETYDPLVLRILGVKGGITSDIALANSWYERAKDLGSIVALDRLKSLAGLVK